MEKQYKSFEKTENSIRVDLNKHMQELVYHMNMRANWLISICSVILVLVISNLSKYRDNYLEKLGLIIIIVCSSISLFVLMLIIVPYLKSPKKFKNGHDNDIYNFRNIQKNYTKKEFIDYLEKLRNDQKELDSVFGDSIYNNASIRLPSITTKLKIGGWSLIIGLILGSLFILVGSLM